HNPFDEMKPLVDKLDRVMFGNKPLLEAVFDFNKKQGYFLPMAFPEGSPMHPAYGAGHATVAGACVTILKAFFDTSTVLAQDKDDKIRFKRREKDGKPVAFRASGDGLRIWY
ncbi:MAG: hypothetical protein AAF487_14165, partial [Bacteroidota bacterium]